MNDILPDLAKLLQKQSWQVLSRLDIETITAHFIIYFVLEVYTRRMDRLTFMKTDLRTKEHYLKLIR